MLTGFFLTCLFLCCTFIVGPTMCFPATHIYIIHKIKEMFVYIYTLYRAVYMVFSVLARFGPIEDST